MATEETIFIKQKILAEDISFGLAEEPQIRNGIAVTGEQVNAKHILYFNTANPTDPFNGKTVTEVLAALIVATGATPQGS